jgi:hypothetical protein
MTVPGADRVPRRARSWLLVIGVLVVIGVVAGAIAAVVAVEPRRSAAPPADSTNVIVSLSPVGGQLPEGGTQTRENAHQQVAEAAATGARGIRVTADVSWLCGADRRCTTEPIDPLVERAAGLGLLVYLHVNSTPGWMDERGTWYAPLGPDADVWADLFAQFVERFGTQVAGYEVWNEPNNEAAWRQGPDPRAYAYLLRAVWTAADAVEPEAQIIGGVLSNNDLGYMHALSGALAELGGDAGNRFFYDQLGVHPYAGDDDEGYDPQTAAGSRDVETHLGTKDMTFLGLERLREQVHEDEGIWRDVVVGEFGYDTTPGAWYFVPEPVRSAYLVAALRRSADWPWVTGFTLYTGDGFAIDGTASAAALRAGAGDREI